MKLIKKPDALPDVKIVQEKAFDIFIEEKRSDISLREKMTYFYMCKDALCGLFLLVMLTLVFTGCVTVPAFIFSQAVNAAVRGTGKGFYRVTKSLFPKKE